jgi:uncharacterized membrane protein (UPF0127 family)
LLLVVVVGLVAAACGGGDDGAAELDVVDRVPLDGFPEVAFRIDPEAAAAAEWCAMLAETPETRSQGLMEQQDLRGYDGMVFRFPEPTEGRFFMRNTRIPLSIAFFDTDGRFVSSADMEPCPDDVADCPLTGADGPYVHALEVAQGDLPALGVGPGSVLSFPGGGCSA